MVVCPETANAKDKGHPSFSNDRMPFLSDNIDD